MKLYANLTNSKGKKEGIGDNTRILIELTYGNKILGKIGLYVIRDYPSGEELGYRIVWDDEVNPIIGGQIVKEEERQKQQGATKCDFCESKKDISTETTAAGTKINICAKCEWSR